MGKLTPKERDCLYLAGRRLSDSEIAEKLGLSTRTVSNHLGRAYSKLGIHDRIRAAKQLSILHPEYPLPLGLGDDDSFPGHTSVQRADGQGALAKAFAKLPKPPNRIARLALILAVAAGVAFIFAGVTVIMSVSTDRIATFAPSNALTPNN